MAEFVVTGAGGMLGRSWERRLVADECDHLSLSRDSFDIRVREQVCRFVEPDTRWVVNCAAWTDVDGAEADRDGAEEANAKAVATLVDRCQEVGAGLVHYSTDYVFDGRAASPYRTDHPRNPVNAYGRSKALGEEIVESATIPSLLIRSSWLYAPWGRNFVLTMRDLVQRKSQLRVVDDQRGRPSSCAHIVDATLRLIDGGHVGTYHVCDAGDCTWFELASHVRDIVAPQCVIEPCTSDEFPRPAPRPAYSVLDLSETERAIGEIGDWRARVRMALSEVS